jgi:hypothetical protein
MADSKISALTSKATPELGDYLCIVDNTGTPETKKCTVAQFLVAMRLRAGEFNNNNVTAGVPWAVVFSAALGSAVDGSDYTLVITCVDALNPTETIGYVITNRTQNGFEIDPVKDAFIEYTAILK